MPPRSSVRTRYAGYVKLQFSGRSTPDYRRCKGETTASGARGAAWQFSIDFYRSKPLTASKYFIGAETRELGTLGFRKVGTVPKLTPVKKQKTR